MESLREDHLDDIAGQDIFLGLPDHLPKRIVTHVGRELVIFGDPIFGYHILGDGPADLFYYLVDALGRRLVLGGEITIMIDLDAVDNGKGLTETVIDEDHS